MIFAGDFLEVTKNFKWCKFDVVIADPPYNIGKVIAKLVDRADKQELQGFIRDNVRAGSTVYTDDHRAYTGLEGYKDSSVKHSTKEFVHGMAHTNGIESFWALLKRGYVGTRHYMSDKYLNRYLSEFSNRHSVWKLDTMEQLQMLAGGMLGKKVLYREITL